MDNKNGTQQSKEEQQKDYEALKAQLQPHFEVMKKAAQTVLDQEVSSYPIFVVYQAEAVQLGIPLIAAAEEKGIPWSINISTLEEFTAKKVIDIARVDRFQQVYKDPTEHFCLFLLKNGGANFVFL
jgi:hypothetical protein